MRRLPILFAVDISGHDDQDYFTFVKRVIRNVILTSRNDPYLLDVLYIAVATISSHLTLVRPLTALFEFEDDLVFNSDGSNLDFEKFRPFVSSFIESDIKRTTAEIKGDRRPSIVLITKNIFNPDYLYKLSVDLHLGDHIVTDDMRSRLLVLEYSGINDIIHLPHIRFDLNIEAFIDDFINTEDTINIIKL